LANTVKGQWRVVLDRKVNVEETNQKDLKALSITLDKQEVENYVNGATELDEDIDASRRKSYQAFLSEFDDSEDEGVDKDEGSGDEWGPDDCVKNKKPVLIKAGNLVLGKKHRVERRSTLASSFKAPTPPARDMTEYELLQQKNVADRRAIFEEMWKAKKEAEEPKKHPAPHRVVRRRTAPAFAPYCTRTEPIKLRSRNVTGSSDSDSGISSGLSTPTKRWREGDEYASDEEDATLPKRRRISHPKRWLKDPNIDVPTPDDITDEMLDNVADYVSEKVYNTVSGTSCHQCRQKTLDTKTVCRSGKCHGVRGAFCGICLKNRYGQDVRQALKDPNWSCPPCLGKCNCSICRTRQGKCPTGSLTGLALHKGHNSVMHYLDALKAKKGNDEFDEE